MKKLNQFKIAAILLAGLGALPSGKANTDVISDVPDVKTRVAALRNYVAENSVRIEANSELGELVVKSGDDDDVCWRKTWTNRADFGDAFGDFWG